MAGVTDHKEYTLKPGIRVEAFQTQVPITVTVAGQQIALAATEWLVHFGGRYFIAVANEDFTAAFQEAQ
jgi:hypothetical protein